MRPREIVLAELIVAFTHSALAKLSVSEELDNLVVAKGVGFQSAPCA